ncbi:MAG: ABC transporter ATP-binding protein [Candidatus Omnitrophica bacterium]|nr:ABC transporter ATP-binding protein [Candidatus Omnitrophota bacterium]
MFKNMTMPLLKRFKLAATFKREILTFFLFQISISLSFLILPYLSRTFIDKSLVNKNYPSFLSCVILGAGAFILGTIINASSDYLRERISVKLSISLAGRLLSKICFLDLANFQNYSIGEYIHSFSSLENIGAVLFQRIPSLAANSISLCLTLGIIFWLNFKIALVLLTIGPVLAFLQLAIRRKLVLVGKQLWENNSYATNKLFELISHMAIIKAFGQERRQRNAFISTVIMHSRIRLKASRYLVAFSISTSAIFRVMAGLVSVYGGLLILKGKLTLGTFTALLLYLGQASVFVQSIQSYLVNITQDFVNIDKLFTILEKKSAIENVPSPIVKVPHREIVFSRITFGYQKLNPVLEDVDFSLPMGKWIGISGSSGVGKTTIVSLLLRFYDPWKGQILFDEIDLKELSLSSLREYMSVVLQEPFLFSLSVRENIIFGRKKISDVQVEEAVHIVEAGEFVSRLPQGYDTLLGENGYQLSGGYKQRIALARALIGDPAILLVDEGTSAIDLNTESKILSNIKKKRFGKTTIFVSHRLSVIQEMDSVIFIKGKSEIIQGAHSELILSEEMYRDYFRQKV